MSDEIIENEEPIIEKPIEELIKTVEPEIELCKYDVNIKENWLNYNDDMLIYKDNPDLYYIISKKRYMYSKAFMFTTLKSRFSGTIEKGKITSCQLIKDINYFEPVSFNFEVYEDNREYYIKDKQLLNKASEIYDLDYLMLYAFNK